MRPQLHGRLASTTTPFHETEPSCALHCHFVGARGVVQAAVCGAAPSRSTSRRRAMCVCAHEREEREVGDVCHKETLPCLLLLLLQESVTDFCTRYYCCREGG